MQARSSSLPSPPLDGPARSLHHHPPQFLLGQAPRPAVSPDSRGNAVIQGSHDAFQVGTDLFLHQAGGHQAHAAVDVIAHPARRDHAVLLPRGRHAPNGKSVALVDVGHGQGGAHDARQGGHVAHLLEARVLADVPQQGRIRQHPPRHQHVALARDLPAIVVDLVQLHRGHARLSLPPGGRSPAPGAPALLEIQGHEGPPALVARTACQPMPGHGLDRELDGVASGIEHPPRAPAPPRDPP